MSDPTAREEAEAADATLDGQIDAYLDERRQETMTNAQLEDRMRTAEGPDGSGGPECGICWSEEEHASGYCKSEETVADRKVEDRRTKSEEVGWDLASDKQKAFLIALTFQKVQEGPNDGHGRGAMRSLALSETAPRAGVSKFIDEWISLDYREDIYFGKIELDDGETVDDYLLRCADRETSRLEAEETPEDRPVAVPADVRDGYYTVVFESAEPSSGGSPDYVANHTTLRVRTVKSGNLAGKTIVSYLAGPNNESDYVGFGFLSGSELGVWERFRDKSGLVDAVAILVEDPEAAGRGYAAESGNCYVCGRTLTDPESIKLGIGPICRGKETL